MSTITVLVLILAIVLNAVANILMKASSMNKEAAGIEGLIRGVLLNPWFIGGLTSFGFALIAYRFVLGKGMKLSVAYPIMTTCGFAIVIFASRIFFHEELNTVQWIGIALLVAGIWLIASQVTSPG